MVNEKRLIDANVLDGILKDLESRYQKACFVLSAKTIANARRIVYAMKTVDAVEVDTVIEMFEYMLGDCPCNFSPVDEWLAERCELQEECPHPKDKRGCWKQFIKHFVAERDGDGNG